MYTTREETDGNGEVINVKPITIDHILAVARELDVSIETVSFDGPVMIETSTGTVPLSLDDMVYDILDVSPEMWNGELLDMRALPWQSSDPK